MTSEYVPTTEQVRDAHAEMRYLSSYGLTGRDEANELFDRWLAQVSAEARRDALREAADERDRYAGDADVVSRWLRALADKEQP
ncbi:hypothetical protein [Microbacterium sp. MPKO10]|uniref:hypothetical protein n=1 Tax=Microbacterium sp. MPKO10 TaxID=2989818 RepID=UPI0022368BB0|nr:hypothetical protein [Microbacterium sp. MPKO10]MCW4458170.1 hypothetical protein [Microbacterium sp. MPKO10]